MNTNTAAASVIGARHQRAGRNGQDAAVVVTCEGVAIAVVCDGCSSGASSEVGARLGAMLFAHRLAARLGSGECVRERSVWEATRADVAQVLAAAIEPSPGPRVIDAERVHDHLLFTIVAAAITPEGAAVWALGDGAYAVDAHTCVLGPFPNNEPPYLAYDLLGTAATAHFEVFDRASRIVLATDGIEDLERDFGVFAAPELVAHPDGLRRRLSQLARSDDRIDWRDQRIVRTPALLQDDLAIAILEVV